MQTRREDVRKRDTGTKRPQKCDLIVKRYVTPIAPLAPLAPDSSDLANVSRARVLSRRRVAPEDTYVAQGSRRPGTTETAERSMGSHSARKISNVKGSTNIYRERRSTAGEVGRERKRGDANQIKSVSSSSSASLFFFSPITIIIARARSRYAIPSSAAFLSRQ